MAGRALRALGSAPRIVRVTAVVAVVTAIGAAEVTLLGDRLRDNVELLLERSAEGEVAAGRPARPPAPLPVLGPPAAGPVAGVEVRALDRCRPGGDCTVVVQVRLRPSPETRTVAWRVVVVDRCLPEQTAEPGGATASPGSDRVARLVTLRLPPGPALAVTAVTDSPAAVAARAFPVSGGDGSC